MRQLSTSVIAGILAALSLAAKPVGAQVVQIDSGAAEGGGRETGHGYMITHDGGCFVIMPRHVAAGHRLVTLSSAAPVVTGEATVDTPFWDGMDLAIGSVSGGIVERCTETIEALSDAAQPELAERPVLMRIRPSGEVEQLPMQLVGSPLYLTFDAELTTPGDELFKGTSGALLYAGSQPLGMIVEVDEATLTQGRFIRIEEVAMNAGRWLDRRGGNFAAQNAAPVVLQASGMSVELVSASAAPLEPELGPNALLGPGAFVFAAELPVRLVFHVAGEQAVPLSSVQMLSRPEAGQVVPKDIRIQVSNEDEPANLRRFGSETFRMAPNGLLTARGFTTAKWIVVTVTSAWDDGPIRIDDASFE